MKKTLSNYYIHCFVCHKKTDEKENTTVCKFCGGPLDVIYDYERLKNQMNSHLMQTAAPSVLKYLDFYPLKNRQNLKTLGEGNTPLYHAQKLGKDLNLNRLYIKNEGMNPTGAFKDRGSFVELHKARELGFKTVCVASTGNMAASVAAYAGQVGMVCYVLVPENTPRGKLAQAISFGAHVIQVRGTYTDAFGLCVKFAKKYGYYLAGDYAFRGEGQKSLSYELCEQLRFEPIDWVIVPVGMGTNFSYIWKGFKEYYELGFIKKLPRMIAVQAIGASPIVTAFETKSEVRPIDRAQTICSAIACSGISIDAPKVMAAIKSSKGVAVSVTDDETLRSQQDLAKMEALYVEPSSATVIAALTKLIKRKILKPDDVIVCVATGAGLKDPATTLKVIAEPPTIEPLLNEVTKVIESGILSLRAGGVGEKEKILFTKVPGEIELNKTIKDEFKLELDLETVKIVRRVIAKFIDIKGKVIAKADLQSIIETIIQDERRKKTLDVLDFNICTSKKEKPTAYVKVLLNGRIFEAKKDGVGPVDAAINAIMEVIRREDKEYFKLTDFSVEIPTTGSDSTVEVTMVLQMKNGTQVVEKGTSPDIIVASIEAFEKGYNELVYQLKERSSHPERTPINRRK